MIEEPTQRRSDDGLGLLEIVISMFLIALLAIAFVPVLMAGLRSAESNSTTATASRLASQALEALRARDPQNCSQLALFASGYPITQVDGEGVTIRVTVTVPTGAACVAGRTNLVRVEARNQATGTLITAARTLVLLPTVTP